MGLRRRMPALHPGNSRHDYGTEIPANVVDEPRWLVIGRIDDKHWSAVIVRRAENIRLKSVRRCLVEDVAIYESEQV